MIRIAIIEDDDDTLRAESAGQVYESNLGPDVIILNAIDGGYVTINFD